MAVVDWLKQAWRKMVDWDRKTTKPLSDIAGWTNKVIVQPTADALKDVPVIGKPAQTFGSGFGSIDRALEMRSGKRKWDTREYVNELGNIAKSGKIIYDVVQ